MLLQRHRVILLVIDKTPPARMEISNLLHLYISRKKRKGVNIY